MFLSPNLKFFGWLVVIGGLLSSARARELPLSSRHPTVSLEGPAGRQSAQRLMGGETLKFEIRGPTVVGLRMWLVAPTAESAIDLTVVRDDAEQGTVNFRFPVEEGFRSAGKPTSGEVLVKIDIPEGPHRYQVIVSGAPSGVVFYAEMGGVQGAVAIQATPGAPNLGSQVAIPGAPLPRPPPKPQAESPKSSTEVTKPPPMTVVTIAPSPPVHLEYLLVQEKDRTLGASTRVAGSLSLLSVLSASALYLSGVLQQRQAEEQPEQISSAYLKESADRAFLGAGILAGLAGVTAVATVIFYLGENPAPRPSYGALPLARGGLGLVWHW